MWLVVVILNFSCSTSSKIVLVLKPVATTCHQPDAQLTPPDEPVCVGKQVVFSCEQAGNTAEWIVTLLSGRRLTGIALSSNIEAPQSLQNDPGFGFEIHVLSSSGPSRVFSELRVTAARQIDRVTVTCEGLGGSFNDLIHIFPLGEYGYTQ